VNESTQKWFNEWANEYDQTLGKIKRHHEMLDLAVEMSNIKAGEYILDHCCPVNFLLLAVTY